MKKLTVLALLAVLASGCASLDPRIGDISKDVSAIYEEDLILAYQMAEQHGDTLAMQCYMTLATLHASRLETPAPVGALSAYQAVRGVRRQLDDGISDEMRLGCAPLVSDSRSFILGLSKLLRGGL
jgi:hypothetical protein